MAGRLVNEQDPHWLARLRVEERIAEIRYQLVVGEAAGSSTGTAPEGWHLEEELLDELAELEHALLPGDVEPYIPWSMFDGRGRGS